MDVFLLQALEYFKSYLENDYFIIGFEGGKILRSQLWYKNSTETDEISVDVLYDDETN